MRKLVTTIVLLAVLSPLAPGWGAVARPKAGKAMDERRGGASIDASLLGCTDVILVHFESFDRINSFLPSGFAARDASAANGAPVPFGMGIIAAVAFRCDWSELDQEPVTMSWVFAIVNAPTVPGLELEQGVPSNGGEPWLDLYILGYYTSGRSTARELHKAGLDPVDSVTTVNFGLLDRTASATITDRRGQVAEIEVVGVDPDPKQPNVRFWLQSSKGTSYFRWNRSPYEQYLGEITSCSLRPDSILAAAFGGTDCSPAGSTSPRIGVVVPNPSDLVGFFRFLRGVWAEPVR